MTAIIKVFNERKLKRFKTTSDKLSKRELNAKLARIVKFQKKKANGK